MRSCQGALTLLDSPSGQERQHLKTAMEKGCVEFPYQPRWLVKPWQETLHADRRQDKTNGLPRSCRDLLDAPQPSKAPLYLVWP